MGVTLCSLSNLSRLNSVLHPNQVSAAAVSARDEGREEDET